MTLDRWLVPELERDPATFARSCAALLALVLIPNVGFYVAAREWVIVRPVVNLDYAWVVFAFPWLGIAGTAVAVGCTVLLETLVDMSYHFHGNAASLLQAGPDLRLLPLDRVLAIAAGLALLALLAFLVARPVLGRARPRMGPNILVLLLALGLGRASDALGHGPTWRPSHAVVMQDLIEDAVIPAVARATEYRGITDPHIPSATAGLFQDLDQGRPLPRRIVLVVVESMGGFVKDSLDHLFLAPLDAPALRARYTVRRGTVPVNGPTVKAEIRELCHAQSNTVRIDPKLLPVDRCLPLGLAARGYATAAFHGFSSHMFDRLHWYPPLGFRSLNFEEQLAAGVPHGRRCGTMFKGLCDGDVARAVEARLHHGSAPEFLYWLTLTAHWPRHGPFHALPALPCAAHALPEGVCTIARLHRLVVDDVVGMALRAESLDAGFIVVGDHPPSFDDDSDQAWFRSDVVPFFVLWPRPANPAPVSPPPPPGPRR